MLLVAVCGGHVDVDGDGAHEGGVATAALDELGDGSELVARGGGGEEAGVEEEPEEGGLARAAASDHEGIARGVGVGHPGCIWARAAGAAEVGRLVEVGVVGGGVVVGDKLDQQG